MILHDNDKNCCMIDFKCIKTKIQDCNFFNNKKSKIKCYDEYNGYCLNLLAQRELLLEILYPDSVEIIRLMEPIKKKNKDNEKKKETSTISLGDS